MGGFETKGLSGTVVQSVFDHPDLASRNTIESGTFRDVLADQAIDIFVSSALSRSTRIGEEDTRAEGVGDGLIASEFTAIVQREGVRLQAVQCAGDGLCHVVGGLG